MFWAHATYSYALVASGVLLFGRTLFLRSRLRRGQSAALLIGAMVPWVGNLVFVAGLSPAPADLTPVAFRGQRTHHGLGLAPVPAVRLVPIARTSQSRR